jgi:hypothetical protein
MTLSALGIFSAAGAGGGFSSDYELITSTVLGSAQPSVTFSNLGDYASTYKHLQIRSVSRSDGTPAGVLTRLNGDTTISYKTHYLLGTGASVVSGTFATDTFGQIGLQSTNASATGDFRPGVIDLLDPYSTTKNKTLRGFSASSSGVIIMSVLWINTASLTSWQLIADSGNYVAGSRFSLYGIKG